jgi:hypothetical protein
LPPWSPGPSFSSENEIERWMMTCTTLFLVARPALLLLCYLVVGENNGLTLAYYIGGWSCKIWVDARKFRVHWFNLIWSCYI